MELDANPSASASASANADAGGWLHFRRLPKKPPTPLEPALRRLLQPHEVLSVAVLHGRGQALVQLADSAACHTVLGALRPAEPPSFIWRVDLGGWSGEVLVQRGHPRSHQKADAKPETKSLARLAQGWDMTDPAIVRQEVTRALERVIKDLLTLDSLERMRERRARKRKHDSLLGEIGGKKASSKATAEEIDEAGAEADIERQLSQAPRLSAEQAKLVCWNFVKSGSCDRPACSLFHVKRPITELPVKLRTFVLDDSFPLARELSPMKTLVNSYLTEISSELANKKCLVLDGMLGNSSRTLLACPKQHRSTQDIVVPNYCSSTFLKIKELGVCLPHLGSLRSYLETFPDSKFGLVYLDYCCRLSSGYSSVEKSPIEDIKFLFSHRMLDAIAASPSILAICLCQDPDTAARDSRAELDELLHSLSRENGYALSKPFKAFEYGAVFVEIYRVDAPSPSPSPPLIE